MISFRELPKPEKADGHSALGASSSHRWMHCAASVRDINNAGGGASKGSIFSVGGNNAHEVGAKCLLTGEDAWTMVGHEIEIDGIKAVADAGDANAVQDYLNYLRKKEGAAWVEVAFHCPDIHPDYYGTSDCVIVNGEEIECVDYKHGVGISVNAERNSQLMMYAVGAMRRLRETGQRVPEKVRLTICQPRAFHPAGPIRSWTTTTKELEEWIENEWLPAAAATQSNDPQYNHGDWCQFCPVKLDCERLQDRLAAALKHRPEEVRIMEDYELSALKADLRVLKFLNKAADDEVFTRLMNGKQISGSKLVKKKADRVWKEGAEAELKTTFKQDAYEQKLKSPAVVEKMPQGTAIVRKFAYKPDVGFTVADSDDVRTGEKARTAKDVFGLTKAA